MYETLFRLDLYIVSYQEQGPESSFSENICLQDFHRILSYISL